MGSIPGLRGPQARRGLRPGGSGSGRGKLGLGLGQDALGALVGLAGLYGQESQHSRVLPELHAALSGEAHVFGQVINGSWKKEKKPLEINFPLFFYLSYINPSSHPPTYISIHSFIHISVYPSNHAASHPAITHPSISS